MNGSEAIQALGGLDPTESSTARQRAVDILREVADADLATFFSVIHAGEQHRFGTVVRTGTTSPLGAALDALTGEPLLSSPWLDLENPRKIELEHFVDLESRIRWEGEQAYLDSPLHTRLYGPHGVSSDVGLLLFDGDRLVGCLCALRTGGAPYGARDRRRLAPLVRPLTQLFVAADRHEYARLSANAVHVLAGPRGEVRHASQSAEALLAGEAFRERLAARVRAFASGEDPSPTFYVDRMECRLARLDATGHTAYLISAVPAGVPRMRASSALTVTQRRIARHAINGATVAEMAKATGCGGETVRSHLREIYRRLGVSTRLELADALGERRHATFAERSHGSSFLERARSQ